MNPLLLPHPRGVGPAQGRASLGFSPRLRHALCSPHALLGQNGRSVPGALPGQGLARGGGAAALGVQCHMHLPPVPCPGLLYEHSSQATARDPCLAETGPRKPHPETGSPLPQASAGHTGCPEWPSPTGGDLVSLGRCGHWGRPYPLSVPISGSPARQRLPACLLSCPLRTHLLLHVFLYVWRGWERAHHGQNPPRTWLLLTDEATAPAPAPWAEVRREPVPGVAPGTLAARPASVGTLPVASPLQCQR